MLAAAWLGAAIGQPDQADCRRAPAQASALAEHHFEQARCWMAAGRPAEALLAVERFLALRPGDSRGIELQDAILRRLGQAHAAAAGDAGAQPGGAARGSGWISVVAGHDSNANSGTDARELSLPLFRGLIVDVEDRFGELRRRRSTLLGANAGFDATVPVSAQTQFQFHGFAGGRYNFNADDYLPHNYRLQAQADHRSGPLRYGLWVESDQRWINRHRSLDALSAGMRVSTAAWQDYEIGLFAAESRNRIPIFELRTREQQAGVSLRHARLPIRLSVFRGAERALGELKMLDRDFTGAAAELSLRAGPGRLDVSVQTSRSAYVQFSQLFLSTRRDQFREAQVAYEYPLSPAWSLIPKLIVQKNRSNVPVTHFSRNQVLAELRWKF